MINFCGPWFSSVKMLSLNMMVCLKNLLRRVNYLSFPVKNIKPLIFRSNELGSFHENHE